MIARNPSPPRKRSLRRRPPVYQLRTAPMIDVVFLLLIFFLLTANFRPQEGFLPTELPRSVTNAPADEVPPLDLWVQTDANGDCLVQIGEETLFRWNAARGDPLDVDRFETTLTTVLARQGRTRDDAVRLIPTSETRWQHVVGLYDALCQLQLSRILFSMAT